MDITNEFTNAAQREFSLRVQRLYRKSRANRLHRAGSGPAYQGSILHALRVCWGLGGEFGILNVAITWC